MSPWQIQSAENVFIFHYKEHMNSVPDTLHNMFPGFKKTLFHVLTVISLFCPLREQRTSLLYAAVVRSISLLFLTSISLWYLVKVIFS